MPATLRKIDAIERSQSSNGENVKRPPIAEGKATPYETHPSLVRRVTKSSRTVSAEQDAEEWLRTMEAETSISDPSVLIRSHSESTESANDQMPVERSTTKDSRSSPSWQSGVPEQVEVFRTKAAIHHGDNETPAFLLPKQQEGFASDRTLPIGADASSKALQDSTVNILGGCIRKRSAAMALSDESPRPNRKTTRLDDQLAEVCICTHRSCFRTEFSLRHRRNKLALTKHCAN